MKPMLKPPCDILLSTFGFNFNLRRYSKGFFELLDIFLRSPALPAYLAAAFIKKLSSLSLGAPPAGAMVGRCRLTLSDLC
jgi:U3 small nucleolar RNA-associated protein 19